VRCAPCRWRQAEFIAGFGSVAVWPMAAPAQGHHHRQLARAGSAEAIAPLSEAWAISVSFKNELRMRCAEPGYRRVERKK